MFKHRLRMFMIIFGMQIEVPKLGANSSKSEHFTIEPIQEPSKRPFGGMSRLQANHCPAVQHIGFHSQTESMLLRKS